MPAQAGIHGAWGAFLSPTLNSYWQGAWGMSACSRQVPPGYKKTHWMDERDKRSLLFEMVSKV